MEVITQALLAAVCGGLLCVIAQLLIDLTRLTPARILVLYVTLGVLIYGIGLYDTLFDIFGTGMSLPLLGFGAAIGRGVKEAIILDGPIGIITGGLTATAGGITVALTLGLIASLFTKGRPKRM
jgi:stage V sporulation protein AE